MSIEKVIYLEFNHKSIKEGFISIHSCVNCENKTFILVRRPPDTNQNFPRLECSACGAKIGRIGFAEDD